jgi:hypothetical protein
LTVNSRIIKTFLQHSPHAVDVPLPNGLRVQILPTIDDLVDARKNQFAAFVASEHLLIVWDDEALNIIPRAKAIEKELMDLVWRTGETEHIEEEDTAAKKRPPVVDTEINGETGEYISKRPTNIQNSVLVSITLLIIAIMLGAGFREIAIEIAVDHGWQRLAFLSLTPVQIFFTLVILALVMAWNFANFTPVLRSSHRRLHCSMHRTNQADERELTLLFCNAASSTRVSTITPHHHTMSSLQRGLGFGHRANSQVSQASHVDI